MARRPAVAPIMAQGRPAGKAKEKLAKNPPATASIETSPRMVQPAKAGRLLSGHRLRLFLLSLQVIHGSFINYFDATTPRGQSAFQTWASTISPGVALVTSVRDNEGLRVGDADEDEGADNSGSTRVSTEADHVGKAPRGNLMSRALDRMQDSEASSEAAAKKQEPLLKSASAERLQQILEAKRKKLRDAAGSSHQVKERKPFRGSSLLSCIEALGYQHHNDADEDDPARDTKHRRRKKRSCSRRRRRSEQDSTSNSSRSRSSEACKADSLFGLAERGGDGLSNNLVQLAKNNTGMLPRSTLWLKD